MVTVLYIGCFSSPRQQTLPVHDRGQSISMMAVTVATGQVMIATQRDKCPLAL